MSKPIYAFARLEPIRSRQQLSAMGRHAKRQDSTELREGAVPGTALMRNQFDDIDPKDYARQHREMKSRLRLQERKGAAIGGHLLVGISPEWIEAAGNLHDPQNQRNIALFEAVHKWVTKWAGPDSVFASRLDLDEKGGGVVDVFVAPYRLQHHKSGKTRNVISLNKPLEEIKAETGERTGYSGLQTSWCRFAQMRLDPSIERGRPKAETGREHLTTAEYKRQADALNREREIIEIARSQALVIGEDIRARERAVVDRERNLERQTTLIHQAIELATAGEIAFRDRWHVPKEYHEIVKPVAEIVAPIVGEMTRRRDSLDEIGRYCTEIAQRYGDPEAAALADRCGDDTPSP